MRRGKIAILLSLAASLFINICTVSAQSGTLSDGISTYSDDVFYSYDFNDGVLPAEFAEVRERAKEFDELEVIDHRLAVRDIKKEEYYERIEKQYGKYYYPGDAVASLAQADNVLGEDLLETRLSIRWKLRVEQERIRRTERKQKRKSRDDELEL